MSLRTSIVYSVAKKPFGITKRILFNMFRIIVLLSLIFSTVGVTITSCACPKVEVKHSACSLCQKNETQKAKSCCPDCSRHLVLNTEFQRSSTESQSLASSAVVYFSVVLPSQALQYFSLLPQYFRFHTISIGSVERCAVLATFMI